MGRQWNTIIESLGGLTGGTISINANLTDIDALLTTLQADVADGITVSSGTVSVADPDNTLLSVVENGVSAGIGFDTAVNDSPAGNLVQIGFHDPDNTGNMLLVNNTNQKLPVSGTFTSGTLTSGTISQITGGTITSNPVRGSTTIGTLTASTSNGTLFATNSTRNYLLIQCTSGTAYIDTNGTATTANGVILTSGQGITFEGSFIPTGAIAAITSTGTAQLIGRQG
jgi:hypothetical protein